LIAAGRTLVFVKQYVDEPFYKLFAKPLPANLHFCQEEIFRKAMDLISAEGEYVLRRIKYNSEVESLYKGSVISKSDGNMAAPWLAVLWRLNCISETR
jgi:hypothetical protein